MFDNRGNGILEWDTFDSLFTALGAPGFLRRVMVSIPFPHKPHTCPGLTWDQFQTLLADYAFIQSMDHVYNAHDAYYNLTVLEKSMVYLMRGDLKLEDIKQARMVFDMLCIEPNIGLDLADGSRIDQVLRLCGRMLSHEALRDWMTSFPLVSKGRLQLFELFELLTVSSDLKQHSYERIGAEEPPEDGMENAALITTKLKRRYEDYLSSVQGDNGLYRLFSKEELLDKFEIMQKRLDLRYIASKRTSAIGDGEDDDRLAAQMASMVLDPHMQRNKVFQQLKRLRAIRHTEEHEEFVRRAGNLRGLKAEAPDEKDLVLFNLRESSDLNLLRFVDEEGDDISREFLTSAMGTRSIKLAQESSGSILKTARSGRSMRSVDEAMRRIDRLSASLKSGGPRPLTARGTGRDSHLSQTEQIQAISDAIDDLSGGRSTRSTSQLSGRRTARPATARSDRVISSSMQEYSKLKPYLRYPSLPKVKPPLGPHMAGRMDYGLIEDRLREVERTHFARSRLQQKAKVANRKIVRQLLLDKHAKQAKETRETREQTEHFKVAARKRLKKRSQTRPSFVPKLRLDSLADRVAQQPTTKVSLVRDGFSTFRDKAKAQMGSTIDSIKRLKRETASGREMVRSARSRLSSARIRSARGPRPLTADGRYGRFSRRVRESDQDNMTTDEFVSEFMGGDFETVNIGLDSSLGMGDAPQPPPPPPPPIEGDRRGIRHHATVRTEPTVVFTEDSTDESLDSVPFTEEGDTMAERLIQSFSRPDPLALSARQKMLSISREITSARELFPTARGSERDTLIRTASAPHLL